MTKFTSDYRTLTTLAAEVHARLRDVPDFPKPGILFKDIQPVLQYGPTFKAMVEELAQQLPMKTEQIVAIEARGFILGAAIAVRHGIGLTLMRKPGKLPGKVHRFAYDLEYGKDALELSVDALVPATRVVIVDDVLVTGGTMEAAVRLVRRAGGEVIQALHLVELTAHGGRARLAELGVSCVSLVKYA